MSILPIDGFIPANGLQLHYRGINCCPNSLTNLDTDCSRRPSPFSLPGVPSTFQEAMGSSDVLEGR